jgi:hypothetical protein
MRKSEQQMNDHSHYYVFASRIMCSAADLWSLIFRHCDQTTKEDSMKSLAYVFAAMLTLAIAAPSLASAGEMHHHHHHHHHHHMH